MNTTITFVRRHAGSYYCPFSSFCWIIIHVFFVFIIDFLSKEYLNEPQNYVYMLKLCVEPDGVIPIKPCLGCYGRHGNSPFKYAACSSTIEKRYWIWKMIIINVRSSRVLGTVWEQGRSPVHKGWTSLYWTKNDMQFGAKGALWQFKSTCIKNPYWPKSLPQTIYEESNLF